MEKLARHLSWIAMLFALVAVFVTVGCGGSGEGATSPEATSSMIEEQSGPMMKVVGWVGPDDGVLVMDRNRDGIYQASDFFASSDFTGRYPMENGFEDLASLDEDGNGVINTDDPQFSELRVWKDSDGDGLVGAGEILTLAQARVGGVRTGYYEDRSTGLAWQLGRYEQVPADPLLAQLGLINPRDAGGLPMYVQRSDSPALLSANGVLCIDLDGDGLDAIGYLSLRIPE